MKRNQSHIDQAAAQLADGRRTGRRGAIRTKLLAVHRWIGLSLCLLLLLQALTGVAMSFRKELNRVIHPQALVVEPASERRSIAEVMAAVNAGNPGWQVET